MDQLMDVFRTLSFFIDNAIYSIIPIMYQLLLYLAQVDIFSSEPGIRTLMNQIYTLLGIFMLFKVAFSFLRYIINPDSFSDNSKGVGKLVVNALIVVVLLVSVPYIFRFASNVQYAVVTSNVIGELILGSSVDVGLERVDISLSDLFDLRLDSTLENTDPEVSEAASNPDGYTRLESEAKDLQFLIYGAFYNLNTDVMLDTTKAGDEQRVCEGTPIFSSAEMANNDACIDLLATEIDAYERTKINSVSLGSFFKGIDGNNQIIDGRNFSHFDKLLWWRKANQDGNNEYVINYIPIIPALAGGYIIFLLLSFCIDIAVRAIKLCFLQILAPISIVSYLDPSESAKDSKLGKWAKECGKTYLSLFIRLAVIFLVIRFISIIAAGIFGAEGFASNINANEYTMWIYVFLVLGAFVFAKQVPKMLENLFPGMGSSGELSLNPFDSPVSKAVGRAGMLGAGVTAGVAGMVTGAGAGRVLAGAWNGLRGKNVRDVLGKTAGGNRDLRKARADGSGFLGRTGARLSSLFGTQGAAGNLEQRRYEFDQRIESTNEEIKRNNDQIRDHTRLTDAAKAMSDRAESQIVNGKSAKYSGVYKNYQENIASMRESRQALINQGKDLNSQEIKDLNARIIAEERKMNKFLDAAILQYQDDVINGRTTDAVISNKFTDYSRAADNIGETVVTDARGRKRQSDRHTSEVNDLQRTVSDLQTNVSALEESRNALRDSERVAQANLQAVHGESGGRRRGPRPGGPGPGGPGPGPGPRS